MLNRTAACLFVGLLIVAGGGGGVPVKSMFFCCFFLVGKQLMSFMPYTTHLLPVLLSAYLSEISIKDG